MRRLLLFASIVLLAVSVVNAQGQAPAAGQMAMKADLNTVWKCGAPETPTSLPVPGQADRSYTIYKGKCTAASGQIAGIKEKEGSFVEFADGTATSTKGHGVFQETLENGDTVTINYNSSATMKGNVMMAGGNTWTIVSGTGKVKGIKGSGSCKAKGGNPDGSAEFTCTGTYTITK